jgi:hypothetical protein
LFDQRQLEPGIAGGLQQAVVNRQKTSMIQ